MLVGENGVVKIADFGLARIINEDQYVAKAGNLFEDSKLRTKSLNRFLLLLTPTDVKKYFFLDFIQLN